VLVRDLTGGGGGAGERRPAALAVQTMAQRMACYGESTLVKKIVGCKKTVNWDTSTDTCLIKGEKSLAGKNRI